MKILFVSSELAPFAKSGELADVAASLPKYLSSLGQEVFFIMPRYRRPEIESLPSELIVPCLPVPLGKETVKAQVYKTEFYRVPLFLVDNHKYFWRDKIYGSASGDYLDNDERFVFFNRSVLEFLKAQKFSVDIIHCHNWPTALIPVFLKTLYAGEPLFQSVATVLTIHNLSYQGDFPPETLSLTGLNWNLFTPQHLSLNGRFNFLKSGILFSDAINTVSSSYKKEIQTKKHGFGLEEILKSRKNVFFSIRNGVDYELWDPATDPHLPANFNPSSLQGKRKCKIELLKEFCLNRDKDSPLIAIISYFTQNKGLDLVFEVLEEILNMGAKLVVCGQGEEKYENLFLQAEKDFPGRVAVKLEMSPHIVHRVIAGSDLMLIPSLYEPCGLNQLYSFRYGTIPIVRRTGGLKETVREFDSKSGRGNGFVFQEYSSRSLLAAIKRAIACYRQAENWKKIIQQGFEEDFSWEIAAKKYLTLYHKALQTKGGGQIGC